MLSSHCRANRPHLGMCPQIPCSFPMATGISWCIQGSPGESGPARVEGNNSALLSSYDGYLLEPTEWPKRSQASCGVLREDLGLLSMPCRKRRASSHDDGRISWFFFELQCECGVSLELQQGPQGASRVAPGKSSLHSTCDRVHDIALESQQGNRASRRIEEGILRSFSSCSRKSWVP